MPPQYEIREKLAMAASAWGSVVGPLLGKQSAPLDLANGELLVVTEGPLVGNRVAMMGGNIARTLAKRWALNVVRVKVVVGRLPLKGSPQKEGTLPSPAAIRVREGDVRAFEAQCLESLPDYPQDAAESLARLRAFFIKRFKR